MIADELTIDNKENIHNSEFNFWAPTKVYIHGFNEYGRDTKAILMKNGMSVNRCN